MPQHSEISHDVLFREIFFAKSVVAMFANDSPRDSSTRSDNFSGFSGVLF